MMMLFMILYKLLEFQWLVPSWVYLSADWECNQLICITCFVIGDVLDAYILHPSEPISAVTRFSNFHPALSFQCLGRVLKVYLVLCDL